MTLGRWKMLFCLAAGVASPALAQTSTAAGVFVDDQKGTPGRVMFVPGSAGWRAGPPRSAAHRQAANAAAAALVHGRNPKSAPLVELTKIVAINVALSGKRFEPSPDDVRGALNSCKLGSAEDLTPQDVSREYFLVRATCPTAIAGSQTVYIAVGEDDGAVRTLFLTVGGPVNILMTGRHG